MTTPPRVITKTTDWRSIVTRADEDWMRDRRAELEYEFTARSPGSDERIHEGGSRIFRGDPTKRGPYAED